jgi:glycosyltransferase involved in cell wall biosynthesis
MSGGYKRLYEILKRGKSEGIDYIIITDSKSCENAVKIFPDFMEIIGQYKVMRWDFKKRNITFPGLKLAYNYKIMLNLALFISKVAKKEDADLIITPSEAPFGVEACYIASIFCSKPWTALFHTWEDLYHPSYSIGAINPLNILKHVNSKPSVSGLPLTSKLGLGIDLLMLLKMAEKTRILTVSKSMVEEFSYLNPHIKFLTITPGNGINLNAFSSELPKGFDYQAVFFARLVPEKGLFDLVEIWKWVTKKIPNAKLAVCGITEKPELVKKFLDEVNRCKLNNNIKFLGQQNKAELLQIVSNSYLTVYPSCGDAFSIAALESLACGTPVVAYNIPAMRHTFGNCKALFRCPIKDNASIAKKVIFLLEHANLRTKLSKEAKEFASGFDWDKVVKSEKEAYLKVVE